MWLTVCFNTYFMRSQWRFWMMIDQQKCTQNLCCQRTLEKLCQTSVAGLALFDLKAFGNMISWSFLWMCLPFVVFKDLSMMYCALWNRSHEGATRISQCMRRYALRVPECLRSHHARYIMLKSDYDMNYLVWYITKPKLASKVPKREVANHAL